MTDKTAYTFKKKTGCDIGELASIKDTYGSIDKEKAKSLGYEVLDGDAWLSEDVDILMPAALENQITPAVFPKVSKSVRVICEAANGPTTADCDPLIQERGILLVPDFLANAGGVTVSYFEQVQCNMNYFWSFDEVIDKMRYGMVNAFRAVYELSKERGVYTRDAAYMIAINKVSKAIKQRGWV
jgi:glutamate dehydrogenase (NAD(P)+)